MSDISIVDHRGRKMTSFTGTGRGFGNQLLSWNPVAKTKDAALLPRLQKGNSRAEDLVRNNGIAANAVQLHIDNIVGHLFRLSFKPRWERLGMNEKDARTFARDVEQAWLEHAEDDTQCFLDAERKRTFTMLIREGVGTHTQFGETLASAEWEQRRNSPLRTCIKTISPYRLSNPHNRYDSARLRAGVELDKFGAGQAYWFCNEGDGYGLGGDGLSSSWRRVERETRWGRPKVLHIFEPTGDGQTRGANQFLSVMEQMHMLSTLQQNKLQNAIVSAMYAATIESELDSAAAMELLGAEGETGMGTLQKWFSAMLEYHDEAQVKMNGVRIPHLMPGESLNLKTPGSADNGFADLESSILRWIAAGTNLPAEPLARNYTQTTYSSARASMLDGWRYFMGRRKVIAARLASMIFGLWFEEAIIDRGMVPIPKHRRDFYEARSSWINAQWIGSGRIAIDGLKEVKEAVLRIESGLSTYEKELALMGEDYQEVFQQQIREMEERREAGLPSASWVATQNLAPDQPAETSNE